MRLCMEIITLARLLAGLHAGPVHVLQKHQHNVAMIEHLINKLQTPEAFNILVKQSLAQTFPKQTEHAEADLATPTRAC